MSDTQEHRRKRLAFRCHHTGMKENNLLLGAFIDRHMDELSDDDIAWLEHLLADRNDVDIFNWITGKEAAPADLAHPVMDRLIAFQYTA